MTIEDKNAEIIKDMVNYSNDLEHNTDEQVAYFILGYLDHSDDSVRKQANLNLTKLVNGSTKTGRKITSDLMHKLVSSILLNGSVDLVNLVIEKYESIFKKLDCKEIKQYQPYRISYKQVPTAEYVTDTYGIKIQLYKKYNVYNMMPFSRTVEKKIETLSESLTSLSKLRNSSEEMLRKVEMVLSSKSGKNVDAELRPYQKMLDSYFNMEKKHIDDIERLTQIKTILTDLETKLKYKTEQDFIEEFINPEDFTPKLDPYAVVIEMQQKLTEMEKQMESMQKPVEQKNN